MSDRPSMHPGEDGMTRRDFLKTLGKGAFVAAAGGAASMMTGCESEADILSEMEKSPTESLQVVPWGEELSAEDAKKARTVDELRAEAGWERKDTDAFISYLHKKYPNDVTEDGTIQPGHYEVPINTAKE